MRMDRSSFVACLALLACSARTSSERPDSPALTVSVSAMPSVSAIPFGGGLRLSYGVDPPTERDAEVALAGARDRVAHLDRPKGVELRRSGHEIIVEVPGTDEEAMRAVKQVMLTSMLSVVALDDGHDPLKSPGASIPPGIHLESERVGEPRTARDVTFAWTEANPDFARARARLAAWIHSVTQGSGSFFYGPHVPRSGGPRSVRSYAVDGSPLALDVIEAEGVEPPAVRLTFSPESGSAFATLTGASIGRRLALMVDDEVMSAPLVRDRIPGGQVVITMGGDPDRTEAKREADRLALALRGSRRGPRLELLREQMIGPR